MVKDTVNLQTFQNGGQLGFSQCRVDWNGRCGTPAGMRVQGRTRRRI